MLEFVLQPWQGADSMRGHFLQSPGEVPVCRLTSHPPFSLLQDKTLTYCATAALAATFVLGMPCKSAAGQAMLSWEGFGEMKQV